jgi:diguanylate cyclase (GGDEF)-like protein
MLHVDVLSGYLICGAGSLVGAAMLRIADTSDARARQALRLSEWGFVVLGVGLLPAGLGPAVVHPASQFSLTFCTLAGLLLLGSGLGELQGRGLPLRWLVALIGASAAVLGWALSLGVRELGASFAVSLTLLSILVVWLTRGMVMSPRDITEGALGMSLVVLAVSCVVRLAFTFADTGPARQDLMYVPEPLRSVLAVLYGVLPMIGATLLLTLVNARLRHQLRMRAITDELTGTMTRRALRELAPALIEEQQRQEHDVAVLMLDLDRFKDVNDTHGHQMGDAVLRFAARVLHTHTRVDTLLARYGGEEFVAVVPVENLPTARRVAERLRYAVESAPWYDELRLAEGITVSVGVAMVDRGESLDAALRRADEALYRAKRDGRNQCQVAMARA